LLTVDNPREKPRKPIITWIQVKGFERQKKISATLDLAQDKNDQ